MRDPRNSAAGPKEIRRLARTKFGFKQLRLGQEEAILSLLGHRDTLVIQPTGSGKSAIYQIAGLLIDGPTVVISPLIALQKDQVDSIRDHDLAEAAVINSQQRVGSVRDAFEKLEDGQLEFLFLAPEQLHKPEMLERLKAHAPSFFVVDEAHCISEWGYDFRPDYLQLGNVIDVLGHPVVLALTATASPMVRDEIVERLRMRDPKVLVRGLDRPNIFLRVETFGTEKQKLEALLGRVQDAPKPGIVYAGTRKHAEDVAKELNDTGVNAVFYHGGMPAKERQSIQESFMSGQTEVIVATNAFGMGVDKSDVRFVYHFDVPDSIDSYYQEIGRCGRDGKPAEAILFYRAADLSVPKFLKSGGKIGEESIREIGEILQESHGPMDVEDLQASTDLSARKVDKVVNRLKEAGAVERLPNGEIVLAGNRPDLPEATHAAAEKEEKYRENQALRLEKMQVYAELTDCRREYLLHYFGDEELEGPCQRCDNCEKTRHAAQTKVKPAATKPIRRRERASAKKPADHPFPIHSRVEHTQLGKGVVQGYYGDKIEVLFDDSGHKTLSLGFLLENQLLRAAGEPGVR